MWPILIKADDLFIDADTKKWDRLIKLVQKNKGHVDIGFISKPSSNQTNIQTFTNFLKSIKNSSVSFFDHGVIHARDEYTCSSGPYYTKKFEDTQAFHLRYLGVNVDGFGAPYNSMGKDFIKFFAANLKNKYIYYPDIDQSVGVHGLKYISHKHHASFEPERNNYDPDFLYFRSTYKKSISNKTPLVLQIHPNRWTDSGFDQFSEILTYLRRLGANFLRPEQFVIETDQHSNISPFESPISKVGDWFVERYADVNIASTRSIINDLFFTSNINLSNLHTVVDFGSGVGDWLYVISKIIPNAQLFGVEPLQELADFSYLKLKDYGCSNFKILNEPFSSVSLQNVDLTICNRALNYFNHIEYVKKISKISHDKSVHYVGYQNISFYLKGLKSALTKHDIDLAKRRVKVISKSIEFHFGINRSGIDEVCVPVRELVKLFCLCGFDFINQLRQDDSGTISGLIFRKNARDKQKELLSFEHRGLYYEFSKQIDGVVNASEDNEKIISSNHRILHDALTNNDYSALYRLSKNDEDIKLQRFKHIFAVLASFDAQNYDYCLNLLSMHHINDF